MASAPQEFTSCPRPLSHFWVCGGNSSSAENKFCPVFLGCRRLGGLGDLGDRGNLWFPAGDCGCSVANETQGGGAEYPASESAPFQTPTCSHPEQVQPGRLEETQHIPSNRLSLTENTHLFPPLSAQTEAQTEVIWCREQPEDFSLMQGSAVSMKGQRAEILYFLASGLHHNCSTLPLWRESRHTECQQTGVALFQ